MTQHRVALADGWTAWRWVALRSAGFPAADVLSFTAPETSRAIDRMLELERAQVAERERAIAACKERLVVAPSDKALRKTFDRLRRGIDPPPSDALVAQRAHVAETYGHERRAIAGRVHERARNPRFREALTWQNRAVVEMLSPARAPVTAGDSATRRRDATVAAYLQRYCVKNDTIGFFGPVGWARFVDDDHVIRLVAGSTLVDTRTVHFEYWCIDAIAARLADNPTIRLALAPRRLPSVRIEDGVVHYPIARMARIGAEFLLVLEACDGEAPATAIAARLGARSGLAEDRIYDILGELVEQRLIRWGFEIPTAGQFPERHLHAQLARLPQSTAHDAAHATLDEIEDARAGVARAAGDAEQVGAALERFDTQFTALTGLAATRRPGETYAGRTLLYEDTRRDIDLALGARLRERLAAPLALVMWSARWYTHAVAEAYRKIAWTIYRALRERTGETAIDYLQFVEQLLPELATQQQVAPAVRGIVHTLQARWTELLAIPDGTARVERSVAGLAPGVAAAFAAPGPGWPQARYQSPDIMVAAKDLDAMQRGELTCVLGEVHTGMQTFTSVFTNLHPDPGALVRARRTDLGRPLISTVEPRAGALRTDHINLAPDDLDIEVGDARSWRARENVLAAAELVVEEQAGKLRVRTRDGTRSFDLVEVFESQLILASATHFNLIAPKPYGPRITIDGLVVARESWAFAPSALAFATQSGVERFVGARRWARTHGLPRFVFVRVPEEAKPCFIDLESPVYVDALSRLVRKASIVKLSEMLPSIDETWLVDAEQRTYTAELRITCVDPVAWSEP